MIDSRKIRDIQGVLSSFNEIYLLSFAYIERHMSEDELKMLDTIDEINMKISRMSDNSTDYTQYQNNILINDLFRDIDRRRKVLYKLMAKAQLFIPLHKNTSGRPTPLGSDDENWI